MNLKVKFLEEQSLIKKKGYNRYNKIKNPDLIISGTDILIPVE